MPSENFQDFEIIVERVIWALKLTPEDLMEHINKHRMDAFHSIPNPNNDSFIVVGAEVTKRFHAIAKRHLASHPDEKFRTNVGSFVKQLGKKFSEFFLQPEQPRPMDEANMDRWIGSALRSTVKEHEAATHYIPCALIFSNTVKQFDVGPVMFFHKDEFFRRFGDEIEGLRGVIRDHHIQRVEVAIKSGFPAKNASTPEQSAQLGNHLTDGLLAFYKRFNWFAAVHVSSSGREISYDRALFVTRGALNIMKLLLEAGYTRRLRTADDPGHAGDAATLTRDSKGQLNISLSSSPLDDTAGDGWLKHLTTGAGRSFDHATRILTLCSEFEEPPPLCARFIDALHWYGEAVTERSSAARIVKFVTAIERICGTGVEKHTTGETRGVTDIVTSRAAILYSVFEDIPFDQARVEISTIYGCRSDLVHGSVSPFDEVVIEKVRRTYEISRVILLAALDYYDNIGLDDPAMKEKGLKEAFTRLERWNSSGRSS